MSVKSTAFACCPSVLRPMLNRIEESPIGYRLVKGTFWSATGTVISRGLMFCAAIFVARILGTTAYGELGMIRSTLGTFGIFAGFGLSLTASKHVAEFRQIDPERAGRIISLSWLVAAVTGGLMAIGLLIFAPWLAENTLNAPQLSGLLRIGAVILFLNALQGAQTGALTGFEAFKTMAVVNFYVGFISFSVLICCTYFGGLVGAVWGLGINVGIYWFLNHLALCKEARLYNVPLSFRHCRKEMDVIWGFSLPATLSGLSVGPSLWICYTMLVNQANGYGEMGILTASMIFQNTMLFAGGMLGAPLLAMICNAEGAVSDRLGRFNILSSWVLGVMVALPLICFPEIVEMLFGQAYSGMQFRATLVLILFCACISMYKQGLARVLAANSLMWWRFASNAFWALVLICSTWHLVHLGAVGVAASLTIAYTLNTLVILPLYHFRNLVPKGTLVSVNAILIWGILAFFVILTLTDVSLLIRSLAFIPALLFIGIAFWRIASRNGG